LKKLIGFAGKHLKSNWISDTGISWVCYYR